MKKIKKLSKNNKRKLLVLLVVAVLLIAGGVYAYTQQKSESSTPQPTSSPNPQGAINLEPATEQDKQAVDNTKETTINRSQEPAGQPRGGDRDDRGVVKPIITYGGQTQPGSPVEVGGYVPGVFEEGGTCTAKFTNGSNTFSKAVKAVRSANSTDCPAMVATFGEFSPKGNWSVVISYESITSVGTSDGKTIEVK